MALACNNDRDEHINNVKQIFESWIEMIRGRRWDEASEIHRSLRFLGLHVRFAEPQIVPTDKQPPENR